jgi:hypothetical protein
VLQSEAFTGKAVFVIGRRAKSHASPAQPMAQRLMMNIKSSA